MNRASSQTPGMWIAIEGVDGCGKSTQVSRLARRIDAEMVRVITTKEPGGAPGFGPALRDFLFHQDQIREMSAYVQLLFFEADRAATVQTVVMPALNDGTWVVSDRGPFGSTVYQGLVLGVPLDLVEHLTNAATGGRRPHLTVILDVTPQVAITRLATLRQPNWFDTWSAERLTLVIDAYRRMAREHQERTILIDGTPEPDAVAASIWECVWSRLRDRGHSSVTGSPHVQGG